MGENKSDCVQNSTVTKVPKRSNLWRSDHRIWLSDFLDDLGGLPVQCLPLDPYTEGVRKGGKVEFSRD